MFLLVHWEIRNINDIIASSLSTLTYYASVVYNMMREMKWLWWTLHENYGMNFFLNQTQQNAKNIINNISVLDLEGTKTFYSFVQNL